MSGFNEASAMPEAPTGQSEIQDRAASQLAAITPSEPSVQTSAPGLAPWDIEKYYWRQNASGNGAHLAPQDSYLADVLDRCDLYMQSIAKKLSDDDFIAFGVSADLRASVVQDEDALDTSGIEGNDIRRTVLKRLIIARKICGASAVSAEHRVQQAMNAGRSESEIETMKADSSATGWYAADIEKRERWGFKAVRLEFIAKALSDGDVIPNVEAAFAELLAKRIRSGLYDDAVERGNTLKKPTPRAKPGVAVLTREQKIALTA